MRRRIHQLSQNELVEIVAQIDQLTSEREIASELEELCLNWQDLNYWQTHKLLQKWT